MMLLPVGRMYIRMESAMSIIVDKISYVYEAGTGFERRALDNVSCAINDGEFVSEARRYVITSIIGINTAKEIPASL